MHLFLYKFCILLAVHSRESVQASARRKFGYYEIVYPEYVSPVKSVPPEIPRPPYVNQEGPEKIPSKILIKNSQEIESIRLSCKLAKSVLKSLRKSIRVGVTTDEIDSIAHNLIISQGAYPSPLGYENFPKSICTSVNNVVVHGIPDNRTLKNGDIIAVDVTVYLNGFHGDTCATYTVGSVDKEGKRLVEGTKEILHAGIKCCGPGVRFEKLAREIDKETRKRGLTVIPIVSGHGIGQYFHELPFVWHTWDYEFNMTEEEKNYVMRPGMVFTVEPGIGEGKGGVEIDKNDKWTIFTADDSRCAQFEHTILITEKGHEILT